MERFDVIVVGSGASGGWVAKKLTEAGLQVLVLEAGAELDPASDLPDETPANVAPHGSVAKELQVRQPVQSRHPSFSPTFRHLFIDDQEHPYGLPPDRPFDWIRSRQVGG